MKKSILYIVIAILFMADYKAESQALPKATISIVKVTDKVKIHTLVSPGNMFANASHIIELPTQLIIVDGQFFAQYAQELKAYADGLKKPVTRFYISHDHPDHFIGFGDAFPNVKVYALKATKDSIKTGGEKVLARSQKRYGQLIAKRVNIPHYEQSPGKETIDGVPFIFEESKDNEDASSLVIKLPTLGVYIAQDIVYNHTHLFITGDTQGWKNALNKIKEDKKYTLILCGHGTPSDRSVIDEDLAYLNKVDTVLKEAKTKEQYKSALLAAYPDYAAARFMDIYLNYYLQTKHWDEK
jgi:glyoxylase-like metal-dependent hydrolase (beta-lactamase superfamily II)